MYDFESQIVDIPDYPEPGVIFKDITPLFGNPEAVSYTHLDVYKRQTLDRALEILTDRVPSQEFYGLTD